MKVDAQINNQPTIRNIAKLLMNSMYGRFGMHVDDLRHGIFDNAQLKLILENYLVKEKISLGLLYLISYTLDQKAVNCGLGKIPESLKKMIKPFPRNQGAGQRAKCFKGNF